MNEFLEQKKIAQELNDTFMMLESEFAADPIRVALSYGGKKFIPEVRTFEELKCVLIEPEKVRQDMKHAYYMYRGVEQKGLIRYDITIIPFARIGKEYNKTLGHYHPLADHEKKLSYPEVYQVLHGNASYILQELDYDSKEVKQVIIIEAKAGDIVYIPPNHGHVTVNPKAELLVMANLVDCTFSSDYKPFVEKKGAAYYITQDGIIKNTNYSDGIPLKKLKANQHENHKMKKIFRENDILHTLLYDSEKLGFLSFSQG